MGPKSLALLAAIFLFLGFQNCSQNQFSQQLMGLSHGLEGEEFFDEDGANYGLGTIPAGPNICYKYSDESTMGECASKLSSQPVVIPRFDNNGNVVIRILFPLTFVDNTYGANVIGWNKHTFKDLVGSDHVQIAVYDKANNLVLEAKLDYISEDKATG